MEDKWLGPKISGSYSHLSTISSSWGDSSGPAFGSEVCLTAWYRQTCSVDVEVEQSCTHDTKKDAGAERERYSDKDRLSHVDTPTHVHKNLQLYTHTPHTHTRTPTHTDTLTRTHAHARTHIHKHTRKHLTLNLFTGVVYRMTTMSVLPGLLGIFLRKDFFLVGPFSWRALII